jgi:[ribosomal protein S5]-alanine N-acetyltransferase
VIVIETPRLFLRHFTLDDVDALAEILSDHDNMRFFPNRFERKDAEEWIEKNLRRYAEDGVGGWALILKPDNKLGGHCGLVRREIDGAKEIEVGYVLARDDQGKGIATEAARACMNYAFTTLGEERVISLIHPENLPSRRVAERNGMAVEKEIDFQGLPHLVYAGLRP